jgi:hypothetical protein
MPAERITKSQALRAARAKLPILGDKKLQEDLDGAVGCCASCSDGRALAQAYRIGAETAQDVIAGRIAAIGPKPPKPTDRTRCPATSAGGSTPDGQLPAKGTQCGLDAGHDGDHSILIPSGAPWFPRKEH